MGKHDLALVDLSAIDAGLASGRAPESTLVFTSREDLTRSQLHNLLAETYNLSLPLDNCWPISHVFAKFLQTTHPELTRVYLLGTPALREELE
jgi:ribonucleotide monophosphatase NagD (HAD superfamily)